MALRDEVLSLLESDAEPSRDIERIVGVTAVEWLHDGASSLVGRLLGRYRVVAKIAVGGMGEVYEGLDERLRRRVALKVLPRDATADTHARARLELEAKAIAAISHPHICPLFDICFEDGVDFLVMEYLDGETLAARVERGPLPCAEALGIAMHVIGALDRAHRAGVVHRDLKPGNVMITRGGAKLLDFGLATLQQGHGAGPVGGASTFGTLRYMAPEQLAGRVGDSRADIWSFGCLLYEMLTGRPAFEAPSREALIAAITDGPPPVWDSVPVIAPAAVKELVETCLAKDPDERWQSAGDLGRTLQWMADRRRPERPPAQRPGSPLSLESRGAKAVAAVLVVGVIGATLASRRLFSVDAPVARAVTRLQLALPDGVSLQVPPAGVSLAISRDGRRVAFIGERDGQARLYVQSLDAGVATPLPETDDAATPAFSADGESIAFTAAGKVKRIAIAGGKAAILTDAPQHATLAWADGRLLIGGDRTPIREYIPEHGGSRDLTRLQGDAASHQFPTALADGRTTLFTASPSRTLLVQRGDDPREEPLLTDAVDAQVVARDVLVFGRAGALWAAQLASDFSRVMGQPRPVVDRVRSNGTAAPLYAVSANGTLVYAPDSGSPDRALVWVDRSGREDVIAVPPRAYGLPRIAEDGTRMIVSNQGGDQGLWLIDFRQPALNRVTAAPPPQFAPVWSRDGRRVYFSNIGHVYVVELDHGGEVVPVLDDPEVYATGITPDGRTLIVHGPGVRAAGPPASHIALVPLDRPRLVPLIAEPGNQRNGIVSTDGRWIAYQSDESGQSEIYVRPFPEVSGGKWQVSVGGGFQPLWSHDGRELFYRAKAGQVMTVGIRRSAEFRADPPKVAIAGPYRGDEMSPARSYDVSPDGKRFLLIKKLSEDGISGLNVVLNWDAEVRSRLAAAGP